jgi:hypothetical protein
VTRNGALTGTIRLAGLSVAALALTVTFRSIDPARVVQMTASAAPLLPLVPLPYLGAISFDAMGWRLHVGAAFAGIKRTREALFIAVGSALLTRGTAAGAPSREVGRASR